MDIAKALERIQHRSTDTDNEDIRELMNSCLQERHGQLQGVDRPQEMTKRGKKIRVCPSISYCADQEAEDDVKDEVEEDEA